MQSNDNIRIKVPVPFLKDKTVIYVNSQSGESKDFLKEIHHDDYLTIELGIKGYTFTYLPNLISQLSPDIIHFMFPGQKETLSIEDVYQRIRDLTGLKNQSGFLYKQNGVDYFWALSYDSREEFRVSIYQFIDFIPDVYGPMFSKSIRFHKELPERSRIRAKIVPLNKEEPLDPRAQAIIDAWEKIEREFGVTLEDVELLLGYKVKLSRLHITTAGNIILTDYEGKEVKMNDLSKAVYFYYLRHPEGASLKELQDHEEEILKYYMGITGRDNIDDIRKSIHNLLDPYKNDLNVSISRIKKAFKDIVGDRIAKFYYVEGNYGGVRKIALDRDYVIWDH